MSSRRDQLRDITHTQSDTNASLWLDKYLENQTGSDDSNLEVYKTLLKQCSSIAVPSAYAAFYKRWETMLTLINAKKEPAKVQGRMLIGSGDESVIETAVTLHHTYGVPFIPGSALKGMAAAYAHKHLKESEWRKGGDAHSIVFGTDESKGYVTFHDALYIPDGNSKPLHLDIMTPHHKDYYASGNVPPADWDNPTPLPMMSATGSYLIAISCEHELWANAVFKIIGLALSDIGVGAKTSSGYGRLEIKSITQEQEIEATKQAEISSAQSRVNTLINTIETLSNKDVAGQINNYVMQWRDIASLDEKVSVGQAILDKIATANRTKKSKEKGWYKDIVKFLADPSA